jgi:hypothetical protein
MLTAEEHTYAVEKIAEIRRYLDVRRLSYDNKPRSPYHWRGNSGAIIMEREAAEKVDEDPSTCVEIHWDSCI